MWDFSLLRPTQRFKYTTVYVAFSHFRYRLSPSTESFARQLDRPQRRADSSHAYVAATQRCMGCTRPVRPADQISSRHCVSEQAPDRIWKLPRKGARRLDSLRRPACICIPHARTPLGPQGCDAAMARRFVASKSLFSSVSDPTVRREDDCGAH